MTRGFDDLTLTFMKQNYVTMTKTIDDNNIKHTYMSLDTENQFPNPILMWGQNNTRLFLYLGAESKYPQILTLHMV